MRYFICLSYNGSVFCGWQIQENARSVQQELQQALSTLLKESIPVTGAGRTDTGVNAVRYIAHFDCRQPVPEPDVPRLLYKLNAILPREIAVHEIFRVRDDAHARFDAVSRTYQYFIHTRKDPFRFPFSHYVPERKIHLPRMNEAARHFLGERDFSSLEKANSGSKSPRCHVTEAEWTTCGEHEYVFTVTANRFLRNMVRAMVGSLLEVGAGRQEPEWIARMLEERNRSKAGQSVPGHALFLTRIVYPDGIACPDDSACSAPELSTL